MIADQWAVGRTVETVLGGRKVGRIRGTDAIEAVVVLVLKGGRAARREGTSLGVSISGRAE